MESFWCWFQDATDCKVHMVMLILRIWGEGCGLLINLISMASPVARLQCNKAVNHANWNP